jgi:hypothetical protein
MVQSVEDKKSARVKKHLDDMVNSSIDEINIYFFSSRDELNKLNKDIIMQHWEIKNQIHLV